MAVRYRSATPGTLLSLAAAIILALVSFNTPLLKSQYFLTATYDSSSISGTLKLGTLGYCLDSNCTGPTVGYEFGERPSLFPMAMIRPLVPSLGRADEQTPTPFSASPSSTSPRRSPSTLPTRSSCTSSPWQWRSVRWSSDCCRTSRPCPCCASRHALPHLDHPYLS